MGAYQANAYQQLANSGYEPEWVARISIGTINAAICGNPPEQRVAVHDGLLVYDLSADDGYESRT